MSGRMDRAVVLGVVAVARERGEVVNLEGVNLVGANLEHVNLRHANLVGVNLRHANLVGADLRDTDLLSITGLSSGHAIHMPTPDGWVLRVGCWTGTTDDLRALIAGDDWPDARFEQITARRPILSVLADMADTWAADHTHLLAAAVKQWGTNKEMTDEIQEMNR